MFLNMYNFYYCVEMNKIQLHITFIMSLENTQFIIKNFVLK